MRPSLTSCDAVDRETEILQKWSTILSTTPVPGGLRGPKSRWACPISEKSGTVVWNRVRPI